MNILVSFKQELFLILRTKIIILYTCFILLSYLLVIKIDTTYQLYLIIFLILLDNTSLTILFIGADFLKLKEFKITHYLNTINSLYITVYSRIIIFCILNIVSAIILFYLITGTILNLTTIILYFIYCFFILQLAYLLASIYNTFTIYIIRSSIFFIIVNLNLIFSFKGLLLSFFANDTYFIIQFLILCVCNIVVGFYLKKYVRRSLEI